MLKFKKCTFEKSAANEMGRCDVNGSSSLVCLTIPLKIPSDKADVTGVMLQC